MKTVHHVNVNDPNRTFVVGDIHGEYDMLQSALQSIAFNPNNGDQLFSLGDLIDRGPKNTDVLHTFTLPGYHAIRGNHDAFLTHIGRLLKDNPLDAIDVATFLSEGGLGLLYQYVDADSTKERLQIAMHFPDIMQTSVELLNWVLNGGHWFFIDSLKRPAIAWDALEYAEQINYHEAIELHVDDTRIGLIHAGVPGDNWANTAQLSTDIDAHHVWTRHLAAPVMKLAKVGNVHSHNPNSPVISNIDLVVMGHTITPHKRVVTHGNAVFLDTGAFAGGPLTIMSVSDIIRLVNP